MSYEEIREHMSRKLANGKRKTLTETEVKAVTDQWVDSRSEEELDQQVVKNEIEKLEKKLKWYNVPSVGSMEDDKGEGMCRIMYSQMNNAFTNVVQVVKIKMVRVHNLNEMYQRVDVNLFAEVGVNWTVGANSNFGSWFT